MKLPLIQKYEALASKRCRLRDLGISIGRFPVGKYNAITDVKGVKVGHATLIMGSGKCPPGKGPVRTGVTIILPSDRIYDRKLIAGSFILNGAGEVSGLTQVNEWGLIETPIALTNTHSVGRVSDSIIKWMSHKFMRIWDERQVVIPVVGECDDSWLNDVVGFHIKPDHVFSALSSAKSGPVKEGSVGSGTGMICCDFKAGIGTSSRLVKIGGQIYTLGVLVMSNFGIMEELRVDGICIGKVLARTYGSYQRKRQNYGSIIAIVATDIPLLPIQIDRICKRSALGIGRVGSFGSHGSGEIIIGFSTANSVVHGDKNPNLNISVIGDEFLDDTYQSVIEATEEAIINSLTASVDMDGADNHFVPSLDLEILKTTMHKVLSIL